jgi:hypothetical protein
MRSLIFLTGLVTIAAAASPPHLGSAEYFSQGCTDIAISPLGVLTAMCEDRKQVPKAAALDLNTAIGVTTAPPGLAFHYPNPTTPK